MSRYIDADKIDFNECFVGQSDFARDTREAAQNLIDKQPAADVEPVRHGYWVEMVEGNIACSECSRTTQDIDFEYETIERENGKYSCSICYPPYCKHCGAKMDGKENGQ